MALEVIDDDNDSLRTIIKGKAKGKSLDLILVYFADGNDPIRKGGKRGILVIRIRQCLSVVKQKSQIT